MDVFSLTGPSDDCLPSGAMDHDVVNILLGNQRFSVFVDGQTEFKLQEQAIAAGLAFAKEVLELGLNVRLLLTIDHLDRKLTPYEIDKGFTRVSRVSLLDEKKVYLFGVGPSKSRWVTLNLMRSEIVDPISELLVESGFAAAECFVLPEQSVRGFMRKELNGRLIDPDLGLDDFVDSSDSIRSVYFESDEPDKNDYYLKHPACVAVTAGTFLLASRCTFPISEPSKVSLYSRMERVVDELDLSKMTVEACKQDHVDGFPLGKWRTSLSGVKRVCIEGKSKPLVAFLQAEHPGVSMDQTIEACNFLQTVYAQQFPDLNKLIKVVYFTG
jgi:hypothetical protein